jgi:hypothetical protein
MTEYYLINPQNEILNRVIADTPELAVLGCPSGTVAVTELLPVHHYPAQPVLPTGPITKLEFLRRFTVDERIIIRGSSDLRVMDFMQLLDLAQDVRLDDPDTVAAIAHMTGLGLLDAERAGEILG